MTPVPRLSVIVPLYNCAPVIERTIASLKAQTLRDFECLLVDDCGPEREGIAKAKALTADDPRFRFIHYEKNLGLGGARNTGVAHATGEWIAFMDQDDLYYPDAFAQMLSATRFPGVDVVEGCTCREPVDAPLPEPTQEAEVDEAAVECLAGEDLAARVANMYLAESDGMHLWNRLYRRAWWGEKRLDTQILGCDDAIFCAEHLWKATCFCKLKTCKTYRFSITPGSQSSTLTPRWTGLMCASFCAVWKAYAEGLLKAYPQFTETVRKQLRWVLVRWIINKCYHTRRTYDRAGRRAIAAAIRSVVQTLSLDLPLKARWRLWLLAPGVTTGEPRP